MDVLIMDCGDKIKGESLIKGYTDKIELLSFSHGISQQITGDASNTKRTSGRPNHQDFTVSKYVDLASATLMDYCNQANAIDKVVITVGQNDTGTVIPFFTYTMTKVLISSISVGGGGGGKPQETVTMNYSSIAWAYIQQKEAVGKAGSAAAGWDVSQNAPAAPPK